MKHFVAPASAAPTGVSTFNFEFNTNTVRVVDIDGEPWFVASDVCAALGLSNVSHAISTLTKRDVRNQRLSLTGRMRPNKIISEGGLYQLLFKSRKSEARAFQDWVTGTVLPALRKDGGYIMGEEKVATGEMGEEELVLKAIEVMKRKIDRLSVERDALHAELYFVSIAEYAALNHVYFSKQQKGRLTTRARNITLERGEEIVKSPRVVIVKGKVIDTTVNVYRRYVLDRAANELDLFAAAHGTQRPITQA